MNGLHRDLPRLPNAVCFTLGQACGPRDSMCRVLLGAAKSQKGGVSNGSRHR